MTETTSKVIIGWAGLGFLLDWFGIHRQALYIYVAFLAIDIILGITHSYMVDKRSITSTALGVGIWKKISRVILLPLIYAAFKGVGVDGGEMVLNLILPAFILSEFYSTVRHIVFFNTKKDMPEMDAFEYVVKLVLNSFRSKTMEILKPTDKKEENLEDK